MHWIALLILIAIVASDSSNISTSNRARTAFVDFSISGTKPALPRSLATLV
jgi:hypothetical protein